MYVSDNVYLDNFNGFENTAIFRPPIRPLKSKPIFHFPPIINQTMLYYILEFNIFLCFNIYFFKLKTKKNTCILKYNQVIIEYLYVCITYAFY